MVGVLESDEIFKKKLQESNVSEIKVIMMMMMMMMITIIIKIDNVNNNWGLEIVFPSSLSM